MAKRKFKPTDGLLSDVMRKQAGSIEKAILEAVMNSVDANASHIDILIEEDKIRVIDNGDGMSDDDVISYFEMFGLKADDIEDKDFGKFRMGRGQIFNFGVNFWKTNDSIMVISLDDDEVSVSDLDHNHAKEVDGEAAAEFVDDNTVNTEGLSYNLLKNNEQVDGCSIEVQLYDELDSVDATVGKVIEHIAYIPWLHDVEITVNENRIYNEPGDVVETNNAYFVFNADTGDTPLRNYSSNTAIYNQGALVNTESLSHTRSLIITKVDLDVNFARNEILDTDKTWDGIKKTYEESLVSYLTSQNNISLNEATWVLEQAVADRSIVNAIQDTPLIEDINNDMFSLQELQSEKITFTDAANDHAKNIQDDTDFIFIKERYESVLKELVASNISEYREAVGSTRSIEMETVNENSLSKKRKQNLERARWFLRECGFTGEVKSGFSKHKDYWKEDEDTLYIHKGALNSKKQVFIVEHLEKALREASYSGSTMEGTTENHTFRRNYSRYSEGKGELQTKLLNGTANV